MWRSLNCGLLGLALLGAPVVALSASPEEAITPKDAYTSAKARTLAETYAANLKWISEKIRRHHPDVKIQPRSLGFRKRSAAQPSSGGGVGAEIQRGQGASGDERYLSVWIWLPEDQLFPSERTDLKGRAVMIVERYGRSFFQLLAEDPTIFHDDKVAGYAVVFTWMKPEARNPFSQKIGETLAIFADKGTVKAFLDARLTPQEFLQQALALGFDGRRELGRLRFGIE